MLYRICSNTQLFPTLEISFNTFFNILMALCKKFEKSFHKKIRGVSCFHLDHLSESYRLIPNTTKTKPRAIYTMRHVLFFLDEQWRLSLHFIARVIVRFVYASVKVAVSFQQFHAPTNTG